MEKINYPCPCGGFIEWRKEKIVHDGIDCGTLEVEICKKCGEMYFPEESMRVVEEKLKAAGLWGVERKEVRFWKSGNSVTVRLPTELTKKLGMENVKKGLIYREGRNKFAIEF